MLELDELFRLTVFVELLPAVTFPNETALGLTLI